MKRATMLLAVLLSLVGALAGSAGAADAAPAATERLHSLDRAILLRLNAVRTERGLRPLTLSDGLDRAAEAHSQSMLEGGFFAHDSKNGTSFMERVKRFYPASGFRSWSAGENLLYNTAPIDAEAAIEAWLVSPAHRENMLEPSWREIGIAALHTSSAGGQFGGEPTWVITMDLGTRSGGDNVQKHVAGAGEQKAEKARLAKTRARAKAAKKAARLEAAKAEKKAQKAEKAKQEAAEKAERAEKATQEKRERTGQEKNEKPKKPEGRPVDRVLPAPTGSSGLEDSPNGGDEEEGIVAPDLEETGDVPGAGDAPPGVVEDEGPIEP